MIDRIPVNILENGAIKYGIYDESGNLLRCEYIKNEDGAVTTGTPLNKANLLSDAVAATIKTATENANDPDTVSAALSLIAGKIGIFAPRIAVGSYTGTGTYGSLNPNSLTFDSAKNIVCIFASTHTTVSDTDTTYYYDALLSGRAILPVYALTTSYSNYPFFIGTNYSVYNKIKTSGIDTIWQAQAKKSSDGKTVYWWCAPSPSSATATMQYNASGYTYYYWAI